MTTVGSAVHVEVLGTFDDESADWLRLLLARLPSTVPAIIDLRGHQEAAPAELGHLLTVARKANQSGHPIAIATADGELRDRLHALGVDRFAVTAGAPEDCLGLLSPARARRAETD